MAEDQGQGHLAFSAAAWGLVGGGVMVDQKEKPSIWEGQGGFLPPKDIYKSTGGGCVGEILS